MYLYAYFFAGENMNKDEALEKKAENAKELGLNYEPVQDSGIVTAGGFDPRTQRTWVGLTDEEIDEIIENAIDSMDALLQTMDKLKDKNT